MTTLEGGLIFFYDGVVDLFSFYLLLPKVSSFFEPTRVWGGIRANDGGRLNDKSLKEERNPPCHLSTISKRCYDVATV